MPGYRAHFAAAIGVYASLWLIATYVLKQPVSPLLSGFGALCGGLLPDYDIRSMSRYTLDVMILPICAICWAYGKYAAIAGLLSVRLIAIFSSHRGVMHTLWFSVLCLLLAGMYALRLGVHEKTVYWTGVFFLAGFISHLLLDRFVKMKR